MSSTNNNNEEFIKDQNLDFDDVDETEDLENCETSDEDIDFEKELYSLNEKLEQTRTEKEELKEAYALKVAEMDNFRKRTIKEKEAFRVLATKNVIQDILEIVDNFDRALLHAKNASPEKEEAKAFLEGIQMIYNEMLGLLEKYNVTPIDCVGKEFDPNIHEALLMEKREDLEQDTVLEELQKGYLIGSEVLRPAKVKIGKKN